MKKVLHLRSSGGLFGAEQVVLGLASHSNCYGYQSTIGVFVDPSDPPEGPALLRAAAARTIPVVTVPAKAKFDFCATRTIHRIVKEQAIDIIHCHGHREDVHALLSFSGRPLVATNHLWKRTTPALRLSAWIDAWCLRYFDRVISVSQPLLHEMAQCGIAKKKLLHIANGIDVASFDTNFSAEQKAVMRESLGIEHGTTVLVTISSLTPEKGHRYLLEALSLVVEQFPNIRLVVVGSGSAEAELTSIVRQHHLERFVHFLGPRSDIPAILSMSDIFVLPSLIEGLPMALLEAMAAGTPVLATNVGDIASVIEDRKNGRLIPAADKILLAKALEELLRDSHSARLMAENARRTTREHFSVEHMAEKYAAVYDSLLT